MNITRDVIEKAVQVLTSHPTYGGAGFEKVCAEYVIASVATINPKNVAAIAKGSKGVLQGRSFAALREYYSGESPLRQARIARWVAENVDLNHDYTSTEAQQLLTDAGVHSQDYELSDTALIGTLFGLAITHRDDALRLDAQCRREMGKLRDLTEANQRGEVEIKALESKLGRTERDLVGAQESIRQYELTIQGHNAQVAAVLKKLADEELQRRSGLSRGRNLFNLRKHMSLTPVGVSYGG